MRAFASCIVLLFGFESLPACAQERLEAALVFPELVRLADAAQGRAPAVEASASQFRNEFGRLADALGKHPEGIPVDYEKFFAFYARELRALSGDVFAPSAIERLELLREDVKIKNNFISSGFGFSLRAKHRVELRVVTVDPVGRRLHGYTITGDPRRYADAERPMFNFANLSSPSVLFLPPGTYTVRARAAGRLVAKDVTVGLSGKESEDVEIVID